MAPCVSQRVEQELSTGSSAHLITVNQLGANLNEKMATQIKIIFFLPGERLGYDHGDP